MPSSHPHLHAVPKDLPEPPYPTDTKANGWKPELDLERLFSSDSWTLAEDEERPWLLRIWVEAWRSVPVGSMPSEHRLFARRIGCRTAFLEAHGEILLRGWTLHNDGLLYHRHITGMVEQMLTTRLSSRARVRAWRDRKKADKPTKQADVTRNNPACNAYVRVSNATEQEQEQEQEQEKKEESLSGAGAPRPKRPASQGFRLDLEELPKEWADWCRSNCPALDPGATWDRFSDYWRSTPGAKGRKSDWLATWRNWCRRELEHNPRRTSSGYTDKTERRRAINADLFDRARAHFPQVD